MPIKVEQSPRYRENQEKAGDLPTCVVCGKGVRVKQNTPWLHMTSDWEALGPGESVEPGVTDMGGFPIGPDCRRKHPELEPYLG